MPVEPFDKLLSPPVDVPVAIIIESSQDRATHARGVVAVHIALRRLVHGFKPRVVPSVRQDLVRSPVLLRCRVGAYHLGPLSELQTAEADSGVQARARIWLEPQSSLLLHRMSVTNTALAGEELNRWVNSGEYFALEVGLHIVIITGEVVDDMRQNLVQAAKGRRGSHLLDKGLGVHSYWKEARCVLG